MFQQILLWVFHFFLALKRFFSALSPRPHPQPLHATRRKVPTHLAVTLSELRDPNKYPDDLRDALESVRRLVVWCRAVGIRTLSVFDKEGVLLESWKEVQQAIEETQSVVPSIIKEISIDKANEDSPLHMTRASRRLPTLPTPPLSKPASSTSLAHHSNQPHARSGAKASTTALVTFEPIESRFNDVTRKRSASVYSQEVPTAPGPLTVHILSKALGKAQMAEVAKELALASITSANKRGKARPVDSQVAEKDSYSISIKSLGSRLEDKKLVNGWPCPDLLLIHTPSTSRKAQYSPLEFEGFPPWQMHLTEMTYIPPRRPQTDFLRWLWPASKQAPKTMTETEFRIALDEYNGAEMRFGK